MNFALSLLAVQENAETYGNRAPGLLTGSKSRGHMCEVREATQLSCRCSVCVTCELLSSLTQLCRAIAQQDRQLVTASGMLTALQVLKWHNILLCTSAT